MAEIAKKVVKYTIELDQDEFNIILKLLEATSDIKHPGSYQLWRVFKSEDDD